MRHHLFMSKYEYKGIKLFHDKRGRWNENSSQKECSVNSVTKRPIKPVRQLHQDDHCQCTELINNWRTNNYAPLLYSMPQNQYTKRRDDVHLLRSSKVILSKLSSSRRKLVQSNWWKSALVSVTLLFVGDRSLPLATHSDSAAQSSSRLLTWCVRSSSFSAAAAEL